MKGKTVSKLLSFDQYIYRFIYKLKQKILFCEHRFVQLLNNFCMGKTHHDVLESRWNDVKYHFFATIVNLKCNCTSEKFTTEIALKFEHWFALCVPLFLSTMMLNESERLVTFELKWPHDKNYVSTEEMARCGMFFTGLDDNVKCAFCPIMLHKWEFGDKPIIDHNKFDRKCPFLYNFRKTLNVSDVSSVQDIDKLIALLPYERSIDEVDAAATSH